ncbi:MAG: AMP-binding protein [Cytophagaceae bacterium]|nr:AMP-binding protein [Cytophagaceae bacterium]
MAIDHLYINGRKVSYQDIKKKSFSALSEYENKALEFCSEWLNEKNDFVIHTSGSTGFPKQIKITRSQMEKSAAMTAEALQLQAGYKSLVCLNAEFIAGKMMIVRSFEVGMEINIVSPSSNPLQSFSPDTRFDFTALVPVQLETILDESPDKKNIIDNMKGILIGGAGISIALENKIQDIKSPVYHTFGMTETISHIALKKINEPDKESCFTAFKNVILTKDERGCLVINSPLTEYPVITNDIVLFENIKQFKWIGRSDNVINSGGMKIFPEKIEGEITRIFYELNLNNRFFIFGKSDPRFGNIVTLAIEGPAWNNDTIQQIKNQFDKKLTRYDTPKEIIFLEKFQETATGKIDRKRTTGS